MERRKFLIGAGTLGAGASVALGTGAFTTVEAQRNVDIGTAGDANAQLAIQALNGANANDLISTEDDGTLSLSIPNVNQDAVTEVEDLFRIVNQGTQSVNLFFRDDSDAVTFRVTRSTQSLEGADNSIQLGVGSQVVVGLTIDTLDNDVSGTLLDRVTIEADASASAPEQSGPQPQYVVDGTGDGPNTFATLSAALNADDVTAGSVIGLDGAATVTEDGSVDVDLDDVTITGFNGTPTIQTPKSLGGGKKFIEVTGSGVTIRNLEITDDLDARGNPGGGNLVVNGDDATVDGVTIDIANGPTGNVPLTVAGGANPIVTNAEVLGGPIAAYGGNGSVTLTGNSVDGAVDNGLWSTLSADFTIKNNRVDDHDSNDSNAKEIKLTDPNSVNGESDTGAQMESLLTENSVNSVQVSGDVGTRATSDIVGSGEQFASVNEVLKPGVQDESAGGSKSTSALVALFENGEYGSDSNQIFDDPVTHDKNNAVIKGFSKPTITYTGMGEGSDPIDVEFAGNDITVEGLDLVFTNVGGVSVGRNPFLDFTGRDGTLRSVDVTYDPRSGAGGPTGYINVSGSGTITFESCTFSDTTSGGSNRYVSANSLYSSGGTFKLLGCVFNDGTRTDANVGLTGTAVYKNNQFNATPDGGSDSITGSIKSDGEEKKGEFDIVGNNFAPGTELLFTSDLSGTVNGSSSGTNKEKARRLSEDNGGVGVNVNFGEVIVGN